MNKKDLTESDIRTKFITPALVGTDEGKWDVMTQVREEIQYQGQTRFRRRSCSEGGHRMMR